MRSPSRRDVLAATGGALAGLAGGYVARPYVDPESPPDPAPLAWADTEWPYPDYDPGRTRNPPPESAPDGDLAEQWRESLERVFERAQPVASNGRVYTASTNARDGRLDAFALADGERDWQREEAVDTSARAPRVLAPGNGAYYRFVQTQSAPLGLAAARTGDLAWHVPDPPRGGWTVGAGRLYYGNRSTGKLHVYDARTGADLWTTRVDDERLVVRAFHPAWGVFASSLDMLYALAPENGSVLWKETLPAHVKSGPVVAGGRAFVSKWTEGMDVLAFDADNGVERWRYPLSPTQVESDDGTFRRWYELGAATAETVLVRERHADPTPGALHAVDAASGNRLWRVEPPEGANRFSKPAVVGDSVYVCTGDDRSELQRRDLVDGSVTESWSLPGYCASPIVTDGRVLAQTHEELLAFA
ncbi:PQQ-binding-like beta-propeller repeat protein [Halobacterium hubeiense]|uniref:outer membrane protein assembly factor BamB family protein n=1 Tax=Halobacterium hubeiense TaxID=1407499 RepID=UPI003C78E9C3